MSQYEDNKNFIQMNAFNKNVEKLIFLKLRN